MKYRLGSEEFYAIELLESGKVIGNIYCEKRDYAAREAATSSTGAISSGATPPKPFPR